MYKLAVIGLGKLGLCTAECFASAGYDVLGVDINKNFVGLINKRIAPIEEPGIEELIKKYPIKATTDFSKIKYADVSFIIVPTNSMGSGDFDSSLVEKAVESVSLNLDKNKYHLFDVVSTVSPGTLTKRIYPIIKSITKRDKNEYGLAYNPEFIALGNVINSFLNPDVVLIGESDKRTGDILEEIYKKTCKNNPAIRRMNIINAEIAKIALNSYITMKINYGNMIAEICEKFPGGNVDDITGMVGSDSRVGPKFLKGGLAYGGPCFPRDNRAFNSFTKKIGVDAKVNRAVDEMNEHQAKRVIGIIEKNIGSLEDKVIAVLGVPYKPNTPVLEESASVKIMDELSKKKARIKYHNPFKTEFDVKGKPYKSIEEVLEGADFAIIGLPSEEYKKLSAETFSTMRNPTILDCWRILPQLESNGEVNYIAIGKGK